MKKITRKKKDPSMLRKSFNFKIAPQTALVFEKLIEKYRDVFNYHFTKTDLLEIAILRLAEFDNEENIKDFYNNYLNKRNIEKRIA